jgi:hypothetical protein
MKTSRPILALFSIALLAACSAAGPADDGTAGSAAAVSTGAARPDHRVVMRKRGVERTAPRVHDAISAQLTYRGGPVLANTEVVTIFWNDKVQFQDKLNTFYGEVTKSPYWEWLSEYNTKDQKIGHGKLLASFVDTGAPSATAITDQDVQNEVSRLIDAGSIPTPDGNTLYMVHFPPGLSIDDSCTTWCAYHSSFTKGDKFVAYGVMPDQGGACDGGCGTATKLEDNTTMVSSHELVEATTDADVGNNNLAWYDDTNGEIGDICVGTLGTVTTAAGTLTVQNEWSNAKGACITAK